MKSGAALTTFLLLGAAAALAQDRQTGMPDTSFVEKAAQINMTEAHLGKLAEARGVSQQVKLHGQKMQAEHTQAYQKLSQLASDKGLAIPKSIDAEHQTLVNRFENIPVDQFDRQYQERMVESHQKALDLYQQASGQAQSPELRNYASQQLPTLRSHLENAKGLGTETAAAATPQQAPAGQSTTDQSTTDQSTTRARTDEAASAAMAGREAVTHYATVVRFEAGKSLELKIRDRAGRHIYDLNDASATSQVPDDLKAGSKVVVHETVDRNGHHSIRVEMDHGSTL